MIGFADFQRDSWMFPAFLCHNLLGNRESHLNRNLLITSVQTTKYASVTVFSVCEVLIVSDTNAVF